MDLNDLRSAVTLLGLLLFVLLVVAVWRPGRRHEFAEAARAPFDGEVDELLLPARGHNEETNAPAGSRARGARGGQR